MKYNFELTETPTSYKLLLNNAPVRVYTKRLHSKQEAEEFASYVVSKAIKQHGMNNVNYNGNVAV